MVRERDGGNTVIVKYDRDGNLLWRKEIESYNTLEVTIDSQDHIIALIDTFVVKMTSDGEVCWTASLGPEIFPARVCCDRFGNIFVVGRWWSIVTVKLSPEGEILWRREGWAWWGSACGADGQGNVIVGGVFLEGGWYECWIVKYSPDGDELWVRTYGGLYDDEPSGICVDGNNNVYVAGGWLVKYDPEGNVIWEKPTQEFSLGTLTHAESGSLYAGGWRKTGGIWYPGFGSFDLEGQPMWWMGVLYGCEGSLYAPAPVGSDRLAVLQRPHGSGYETATTMYTLPCGDARRARDVKGTTHAPTRGASQRSCRP